MSDPERGSDSDSEPSSVEFVISRSNATQIDSEIGLNTILSLLVKVTYPILALKVSQVLVSIGQIIYIM